MKSILPMNCTRWGVNDSMIHVDFMIGSEDLEIDGITGNGEAVALFRDGVWCI